MPAQSHREELEALCRSAAAHPSLHGSLLQLRRRLDHYFVGWARDMAAEEFEFPPLIAVQELGRTDYFESFPHLATFPTALAPREESIARFVQEHRVAADGSLALGPTAPIRHVLTPAVCYHFYIHYQGQRLDQPLYLTAGGTCFRHEQQYAPLQRQWAFYMRELVCIGTSEEVKAFLARGRAWIDALVRELGLEAAWQTATDAFFQPQTSSKHLSQLIDPVKHELVFERELAIASSNFHRNYFGECFSISRSGSKAFSGCVAFGLDRWLHAILAHFGHEPDEWPALLRSASQ